MGKSRTDGNGPNGNSLFDENQDIHDREESTEAEIPLDSAERVLRAGDEIRGQEIRGQDGVDPSVETGLVSDGTGTFRKQF